MNAFILLIGCVTLSIAGVIDINNEISPLFAGAMVLLWMGTASLIQNL